LKINLHKKKERGKGEIEKDGGKGRWRETERE
jgi:hypothetical protein